IFINTNLEFNIIIIFFFLSFIFDFTDGLIARYQNTFAPTLTWNAAKGHTLRNEGSELNFGLSNSSPHSYFIQGRTCGSAAKQIVLNPLG
mgnify:CR=1